jgi:hypothetical protein
MERNAAVRLEILTQCYAVRPGSRDAGHVARLVRRDGDVPDCTEFEVAREAAYLVDIGLLAADPNPVSAGAQRWKISGEGVQFLEREGWI